MWIRYILLLSLATSILGALKNYVKYKQFEISLFFRTPIICLITGMFLKLFFRNYIYFNFTSAFFVIILERWLMLSYKSLVAYYSNNYLQKKEKYKVKYGLKYQ